MPQGLLVLRKYYARLVSVLAQCLNELLLHLVSEEVITIEDKNTIKKFGDTPYDRAEYLLDNHINRPLTVGSVENLAKLLKVMQMIPSCGVFVTELLKALKCDTHPDVATGLRRDAEVSDEAMKKDRLGMINAYIIINHMFCILQVYHA